MIIRSIRTQKYTVIPNLIIEDKNLDWKELGLLVFLLSKPDEWEVSVHHLARQRKAGRDAVLNILKVLRDAGYVVMNRRPEGGVDYVIYDSPQVKEKPKPEKPEVATETPNPKPEKPLTDYPLTENPLTENTGVLVSTEKAVSTEIEVKTELEKKTKSKKFIKPTVAEIADYCKSRNNKINAQKFFDYYQSIGWKVGRAPMKDWQAAVRTWEQREVKAHETHQQGNQLRGAAAQSASFHEDLKRFAQGVDSQTVQQDAGDIYPPVDKRVSNY